MSTPRIEHIAVNIEATVNAITEGDGFNQDLVAVRPKRNDFKDVAPEDGKVLIWQADDEKPEEQAFSALHWIQPFVLMAIVLDSDDAETSIDTRLNQVRADIQRKLIQDITRGGYAFETVLLPCAKFDDGQGFTGIAVNVAVHYRVKDDDPYTGA